MSNAISHFFAMGGYALYIWPAYGVSAVVLGWIAIASWRRTKANEAELKKLQDQSPHRRRRASVQVEETP
jgi:heme exporter protein D